MPDNTFTIGATVSVAQLRAGFEEAGNISQEALREMMVDFSTASSAASNAVSKISADTEAMALTVSSDWKTLAAATLQYRSALKEVTGATYLARVAGQDDAAAVALLAAAKQKAAAASVELAAAEKAVAGASETEALSLGGLSGVLGGALSSILGVTLGIGLLVHQADGLVEFNLQMRNLSLTTGIGISTLAGLHDVVKEMGGDFDPVAVGLSKMEKAQHDVLEGTQSAVDGFKLIGITAEEVKSLTPEELLFRVAQGFQQTASSADKNTAAIDIFGRGGRALIAVFEALGPQMQQYVTDAAAASSVTDASAAQAQKYNQAVEQLTVAWRGVVSVGLPLALDFFAEVGAGLEILGDLVIDSLDAIGAYAMTLVQSYAGVGKIIEDVVTGNFGAIVGDAKSAAAKVSEEWKGVGRDVKADWKEMSEAVMLPLGQEPAGPTIKKPVGEDEPSGDTGGKKKKDTRLEQWRAELQAKKDAEDGFHELSNADEAKFWESKLELAKGNSKLYAEVYHQMRENQRAEQKDSLKDESGAFKERLGATKPGSSDRVTVAQEEANHLKSIHAEETEFYKQVQADLASAVKAYSEQQGKDAVEAERRKVEATRTGSEERVAAERALLAEMESLGMQETSAYTEQMNRVTEAVHAAAAERVKLQELDIEQARIVGLSKLQVEKQNIDAETDLHRMSARQRIAALEELEKEEYAIELEAMSQKLALMEADPTNSPATIQKQFNAIENLTREHNNRMAALNTQGAKDSEKAFDQFFSRINSGFTNSLNGMLTGHRTFAKDLEQMWTSTVSQIADSFVKMRLAWIENHLLMRAYSALFHTQDYSNWLAGEQAKTTATAAGTTQRGALEDLALLKNIARAAEEVAIHIAKELAKTAATIAGIAIREVMEIAAHLRAAAREASEAAMGAFRAVMANVPFPANVILAPAAAVGAFAGVMALASAEGGMEVGHDQLAFIHKNEMVLPASLSSGFKNIIGNMGPAGAVGAAGAPGSGAAAGAGSVTHVHHYNVTVHAGADREEMMDMVERNLVPMIRSASRKGLLPST